MKKEKKARIVDVKIHELSPKGNGIGYYDHPYGIKWTLEVPFAIPGDYVKAMLIKKRNGIHLCRFIELLESSPDRILPKCVHFGVCGGCRWQQIPYVIQLKNKELHVKNCFKDLLTSEITCHPIIPCTDPWGYRNKMEFTFSSNRAGERFLGLIMDSSGGKVINLTECHLVNSWFVDALKATKTWWDESGIEAYNLNKNTGSLRTLIVREGVRTGERLVMLTVSGNPDYALNRQQLNAFIEALRTAIEPSGTDLKLSLFLRIQQIAKGRPTEFFEMPLYGLETIQEHLFIQKKLDAPSDLLKFDVSPSAFFQPNTVQAEKLYSLVLQLIDIPENAVVYDLYCGTGTLGICLSKQAKEVIGVELSRESAHDAKGNLVLNDISNMKIISGDVGKVLNELSQNPDFVKPDVVVVDPPRAGLDPQAIQILLKLKASTIAYVSCNPVTQASNISELIRGGYQLKCLQPVDQFPHTVHIENIAILGSNVLA